MLRPLILPSNQPADRFYRGGERIAAFRGEASHGPRTPEDWVGSTTTVRGHATLGRTRLADGTLLVDRVAEDPTGWLGAEHIAAFGVDTKLLVKLLDAGQRLPVHAHPDTAFASAHVGTAHGKAEAWYLLTPGDVWLGLRETISLDDLLALVEAQDIEGLLGRMHRVHVEAHQTVYVPPGLLHAIGEGILLAEVQEPEDLSILLEWRDFELDGAVDGHLGLGFPVALQAVETRGRTADEIASLVQTHTSGGRVLAQGSEEFFRLERVEVDGEAVCGPGFAVLIATDGDLTLVPQDDEPVAVPRGTTALLPHAAGGFTLLGAGTVLIARPPRVS
jgi:mannose-6-phosphate isomerase